VGAPAEDQPSQHAALLVPNLWVQQGIPNVNEQVNDQEDEGKDKNR
jgi:hypothetical protein